MGSMMLKATSRPPDLSIRRMLQLENWEEKILLPTQVGNCICVYGVKLSPLQLKEKR